MHRIYNKWLHVIVLVRQGGLDKGAMLTLKTVFLVLVRLEKPAL